MILAVVATPALAQGTVRAPSLATVSVVAATTIPTTVYGSDIVRVAREYVGVPYRWGGTTPDAFDCSGFVRYVFSHFGLELPRTAHEQAAFGVAPEIGDLRAGDLLFFWGGDGAQHIGIYVAADTIIHASSGSGMVTYGFLHHGPNHKTWLGVRLIAVRRVLPATGVLQLPATDTKTTPPVVRPPIVDASESGGGTP